MKRLLTQWELLCGPPGAQNGAAKEPLFMLLPCNCKAFSSLLMVYFCVINVCSCLYNHILCPVISAKSEYESPPVSAYGGYADTSALPAHKNMQLQQQNKNGGTNRGLLSCLWNRDSLALALGKAACRADWFQSARKPIWSFGAVIA